MVTLASRRILFRLLVFGEPDIARSEVEFRSVHRFDEPLALERNDPQRTRLFVPDALPMRRLHDGDHGGIAGWLPVHPFGIRRGRHTLQREGTELAACQVTYTSAVGPKVPIGCSWRRRLHPALGFGGSRARGGNQGNSNKSAQSAQHHQRKALTSSSHRLSSNPSARGLLFARIPYNRSRHRP